MKKDSTTIYVFADWKGMTQPELMESLMAHQAKGKKAFSFEYNPNWLKSKEHYLLDPNIQFFSGPQFAQSDENFGLFLDSMPDTWGRTLMKRRAAQEARKRKEKPQKLYEVDYLLGVYDRTRMGGLRFKTEIDGPFLDDDQRKPTPPWSKIRKLQTAAKNLEEDNNLAIEEWLNVLIAPGSSLGGARPKANIVDEKGELWIAKFPSKNDPLNKAAWEYLAYKLALNAGIKMAPSKLEKISGNHHTFFTKRFDREGTARIHFSSAMTMTGFNENILKTKTASYLDIAEFILTYGADVNTNLKQLWRRIVFNIAISNTDDHLRNHGFILTPEGWELSPAYDLNPSIDKDHLSLNINEDDSSLELELAKEVGEYFRLTEREMDEIVQDIQKSVSQWKDTANQIGISRTEQELMKPAFWV